MAALPQALATVHGSIPDRISTGAVESLGVWARTSRELLDRGLVPPDVLTGMTLYLLARQPRKPRSDGGKRKGAIAGGVWVREQVTFHHPVRIGQELVIEGESARRFSRRGRRYGVTTSQTYATDGRLLVSSCTTGLLRYRREEGLDDEAEGRDDEAVRTPKPDAKAGALNPAREKLAGLRAGDRIEGETSLVTLELMRVRDAARDENPIHTDPEVARREGLAAPIAGGSHVLAFLHEALMRAWGREALLYGAHFDVEWKAQTYAGTQVTPSAVVVKVTPELATLSLEVRGEERIAMQGSLQIPLAPGSQRRA